MNDTLVFVNCFDAEYRAEQLADRPASCERERFFYPARERAGDGLLVRVACAADWWYGVFKFGHLKFSGLFSHPDTAKLCVVSRGICYIVNVANPAEFHIITERAVGCAVDLQRRHLIVYSDYELYALGREGIAWKQQLRADGIHDVRVTESAVVGKAEMLGYDGLTDFAIDAATGQLIHAAEPAG